MSSPRIVHERAPRRSLVIVGWLFSVCAHAFVFFGLLRQPPSPRPEPAPSAVRFEIAPPPPKAPPQELEPAKPEVPREAPAMPPKPTPASRREAPAQAEPSSPSEPSGTTLASEDGHFEMPAGNGEPMTGPITVPSPNPGPAPKAKPPSPSPAPAALPAAVPKTVPLADLSRRPKPPSLDGALERNYPAEARRRGIGGRAVVRARIESDGKVRSARVVSETEPGFGEACRRTVLGTSWSAPADRDGQSVATEVSYVCRFRIND